MVKTLLYIGFGILLNSCQNHENYNIVAKAEIPLVDIHNEALEREIKLYMDSVSIPSLKDKMVHLSIRQLDDSTVYKLSYAISAFDLINTPSTYYSNINGQIIAVSYEGVKEISLSERTAWKYLKDVFPKEYDYFKINDDYPPPPTSRELVWILILKGANLIEKKEILN